VISLLTTRRYKTPCERPAWLCSAERSRSKPLPLLP
jgi:hypothetical protein